MAESFVILRTILAILARASMEEHANRGGRTTRSTGLAYVGADTLVVLASTKCHASVNTEIAVKMECIAYATLATLVH